MLAIHPNATGAVVHVTGGDGGTGISSRNSTECTATSAREGDGADVDLSLGEVPGQHAVLDDVDEVALSFGAVDRQVQSGNAVLLAGGRGLFNLASHADDVICYTGRNAAAFLEIRLADVFAELDRCPPPT